jgi:hypothetical protein
MRQPELFDVDRPPPPVWKCLTVCQPYAWLIVAGHKRFENRTWRTGHRGPLLIHAGKSRAWMNEGLALMRRLGITPPASFTFGAIVGAAELVGCPTLAKLAAVLGPDNIDPFAFGPYCWELTHARALLEPIACAGQQTLFTVDGDLLAAAKWGVADQLRS